MSKKLRLGIAGIAVLMAVILIVRVILAYQSFSHPDSPGGSFRLPSETLPPSLLAPELPILVICVIVLLVSAIVSNARRRAAGTEPEQAGA